MPPQIGPHRRTVATRRVHDQTPPGLDVAVNVTGAAQEHDAVAGWIRFVPLEFVVRDLDLGAYVDMRPVPRLVRPIVGDGGVGLAVPYMDLIGPIGVGLAAAGGVGNVRLHQH